MRSGWEARITSKPHAKGLKRLARFGDLARGAGYMRGHLLCAQRKPLLAPHALAIFFQ
jgi:hypothetical protein